MVKLRTLCQNYLAENFWLAESTKETTERAFRYLIQAIGNRNIDRVNFKHCSHYKGWLLKTGRGRTTANIYLRSLSPVFFWAIRLGLLEQNPCCGVKQFKVTKRPIRVYEDWQIERMFRFASNKRWQAILLCARTTGLRRGEILNLTLDNIRGGFIFVEPKRDSKTTWLWEPKDKEIRKIPLIEPLAELIKSLGSRSYPMLSAARYSNIMKLKAAGLLTDRIRRCPEQNFRRTFVNIQRRAFGRQIGDFHSLRKTYTTSMCEQLPEHFVMRLTGHSSLKTMTYYLASRESYYETAKEIASKAIKNGVPGLQRSAKEGVRYGTPTGRYWT